MTEAPDPVGPKAREAQIIPFPLAARPPAVEERARLLRALQRLDEALAEQKQAVEAWRVSLSALRSSMGRLGGSVGSFQQTLGALQNGVGSLNAQSRQLTRWAERAGET